MKKLWKALGITTLAAAAASVLVPYRVRKDKEENVTTVDALLWQMTRRPGEGEEKSQVDITLGFKSPLHDVREEQELFTEDPEEAVMFADDELEAAKDAAVEAAAAVAEAGEAVAAEAASAAAEAGEAIAAEVEKAADAAAEAVEEFDPDL